MAYLAVNKDGKEVVFYGNTTPSMLINKIKIK